MYLFSDLDNTLIYSHRNSFFQDRVAVEYLNNSVQSYMTEYAYSFFSSCKEITLIPITTRTVEQYMRLANTFKGFGCKYALVCNGGLLLENNEINKAWKSETLLLAKDEISDFKKAEAYFMNKFASRSVHFSEDIMVYVKTERPEEVCSELTDALNDAKLNIFCDARKVYCTPLSVNKGSGLKRFSALKCIQYAAAAGDGTQDISMLEAAALAFIPKKLTDRIKNENKRVADDSVVFSDFICDEAKRILRY